MGLYAKIAGAWQEIADDVGRVWVKAAGAWVRIGDPPDPVTYTNLVTNPSIEVATTGYTAGSGNAVARVTNPLYQDYGLRITMSTTTEVDGEAFLTDRLAVTPGKTYTFTAYFKRGTGLKDMRLVFNRFNVASGGSSLGKAYGDAVTTPADASWIRATLTYTIPAGTTYLGCNFGSLAGTAGTVLVDGIMIHDGSTALDYFDGETADDAENSYAWTGTAHASTSTRVWSPA